MKPVNEASTFTARARFIGMSGEPVIPSSVRYLIKDVDNDRVVLDWTDLSPAASIEWIIPASANAIHEDHRGRKRRTERRVLTIQSNYGQDTQVSEEEPYVVRNLRGFDS
jgi:hypothetical protein